MTTIDVPVDQWNRLNEMLAEKDKQLEALRKERDELRRCYDKFGEKENELISSCLRIRDQRDVLESQLARAEKILKQFLDPCGFTVDKLQAAQDHFNIKKLGGEA